MLRITSRKLLAAALALGLSACSGTAQSPLPYMRAPAALLALNQTGAGKITHVVFIIQENRSFDNLFQGFPHADTVSKGRNSHGRTIELKPVSLADKYEIGHDAQDMFLACNGTGKLPGTDCRMNGFDLENVTGGPPNPEYVYVPHSESKPYFDMAREWVLADRMFQSQLDNSFVAHQYAIAAQAGGSVNLPLGRWGCHGGPDDTIGTILHDRNPDGPRILPCFNYQTLGDELDRAHLSWRFYASAFASEGSDDGFPWSAYQAVKHIRDGPDWRNDVISPNYRFITDVRAGKLANFTWITPVCYDSDHMNCGGGYGPSWVSALVNTVGKSKFWKSTAIFVIWDDWGGLYDHVAPKYLDRDSLGFRVPMLVISPYAKKNFISHVPYETASVLRFAEDLFGLDQLAAADARAASPAADSFDFSQPPRAFVKIAAPVPPGFFMHHHAGDDVVPDEE